jgi:hypothetical protein
MAAAASAAGMRMMAVILAAAQHRLELLKHVCKPLSGKKDCAFNIARGRAGK